MNLPPNLENAFDALVQRAMQAWDVPGLAAALVLDDRVVFARGYGIRALGQPETVDEHTLFAIGSNTKAFTAAALGLLVEEGKLAWDDPVRQHLPWFRLHDPHATELITLRDLLCHRSGLGTWAGDMLLYSNFSSAEVGRRLRHIPPAFGFRAEFGYSNLMFITAGLVIEAASGQSWDDFVRSRLFEPLGMAESVTNPGLFSPQARVAAPHELVHGTLQPLPYRPDFNAGAAGAICASAADITRWLRLQLNDGSLDGRAILSPATLAETHTPHTPIRLSERERLLFPSRHFAAYGLGWFLSDLHGRLTVRHTGGVDGMLSSILLVPEDRIGIAVFSNKLPNAAFSLLPNALLEMIYGLPARDWVQTLLELEGQDQQKERQAEQRRLDARIPNTQPALPLAAYTGRYANPLLGSARLRLEAGGLRLQLEAHPDLSATLEHWHYDTFCCTWDNPVLGQSWIPFISDGQGRTAEFRVKIREDWIDPLEHRFTKIS